MAYTKRYEFKKIPVVSFPETTAATEITDTRIKIDVLTKEVVKKHTFDPKINAVFSLPLQWNAKRGVFEIIETPSLITSRTQGYYFGATLPTETNAGYYYAALDSKHALYTHLLADDSGIVKSSDIPKSSTGNIKVSIAEAAIQTPVDVQSVLANKFQQLINADETVAQSITLDTEGCKLLEVYATAAASTTFHLDVSNDNTNWFTDYKTYSAVTSVKDTLWNGFRYVKLRSDAAGSAGNKVTLSLAAKP